MKFAALVGHETYRELSEDIPTSSLFGDWLFSADLFEPSLVNDEEYLSTYLPAQYPGVFAPELLDIYTSCRALVDPFLDACIREIDWTRFAIVGFTTTFQQTVASLALARRVKKAQPFLKIAMGGANCEGEMGVELHRKFPFIDFVFSGESDHSFPVLAGSLINNPDGTIPTLQGVTGHTSADSRESAGMSARPIENLDELPYPDYTDFVEARVIHGFSTLPNLQFLIETSRGCWWGEKHHCTFCGLNGQSMVYRSKSPDRVVAEIRHLKQQYGARSIWGTDNIFDTKYFRTLLPTIKALDLELNLFFETKSNIRKDQLLLMKESGLNWFQPGIESLNTHQLSLMKKGCTALQNIQLLKWARQYRMNVTWNMLMGFPGETSADYRQAASYCDVLHHLQPPSGAHPIRLDCFSPYYANPQSSGLTNVRPYGSYAYVFPFENESLERLAYFFTFDYENGYDPVVAGLPLLKAVARWARPESLSVLYAIVGDTTVLICDTRQGSEDEMLVLHGLEAAIYLHCDAIRSLDGICRHVKSTYDQVSANDIRLILGAFIAKRLMLEEDGKYLSLAVLVDSDTDLAWVADPRSADARPRTSGSTASTVSA